MADMDGYIFDYRAGHARGGCALAGFDVLGENAENAIVTLGGYTTPEQAKYHTGWADHLLKKYGGVLRVKMLNGCTNGYTSAQEMTRFVRDVILLKPKLVIILSGFYNFAYKLGFVTGKTQAKFLKTHPFTTPVQMAFLSDITSRFGLGNQEVYYGEENNVPAHEYWLGHMDIISSLCAEFGLRLKVFLQPCVFSGHYLPSEREKRWIKKVYGIDDIQLEAFHSEFQASYENTVKAIAYRRFITDLSGLFDDDGGVYADAVHVQTAFTQKIAGAVYAGCESAVRP